jgi:hypothetical protein
MAGLKFGARAKGKNGEWVRWTPPWVDRRAKGLSVRSYASNEVHGRPGLGFARLFFCARPTQGGVSSGIHFDWEKVAAV